MSVWELEAETALEFEAECGFRRPGGAPNPPVYFPLLLLLLLGGVALSAAN